MSVKAVSYSTNPNAKNINERAKNPNIRPITEIALNPRTLKEGVNPNLNPNKGSDRTPPPPHPNK